MIIWAKSQHGQRNLSFSLFFREKNLDVGSSKSNRKMQIKKNFVISLWRSNFSSIFFCSKIRSCHSTEALHFEYLPLTFQIVLFGCCNTAKLAVISIKNATDWNRSLFDDTRHQLAFRQPNKIWSYFNKFGCFEKMRWFASLQPLKHKIRSKKYARKVDNQCSAWLRWGDRSMLVLRSPVH